MGNLALATKTKKDLVTLIEGHSDNILKTLPEGTNLMALAQDLKFAIDASENNHKVKTHLSECTPQSLLACCVTATNFGVSVNPSYKQAYLIPYKMGQKTIAQLNISYIGLVNMIRTRTGIKVRSYMVYENEQFEHYNDGFETVVRHTPIHDVEKRGAFKCVVAIAKELDGELHVDVMEKEDVIKCKNASPSAKAGFGPWVEWFDQMAMKAVVRRLCKTLPLDDSLLLKTLKADEDVAIGRSQVLTDAYEEMGIKIDEPQEKTQEEVAGEFDAVFNTDAIDALAQEVENEQ